MAALDTTGRDANWPSAWQVNIRLGMLAVAITDTIRGQKLRINWSKDETARFTDDIKVSAEQQLWCFCSLENEKLEGAACCH